MVPGLVRTKASSVIFGTHGIAVLGQISQLQGLVITVGTAGLVSATRVILSRRSLELEQLDRLKNWLLLWPAVLSVGVAVLVTLLSKQLSHLLLGDSSQGTLIALAAWGVPFAVTGQIALAIVQVQSSRRQLVIAALSAGIIGGLSVLALVGTARLDLMAATFIVAPACQFGVIMVLCREARPNLRYRPRISRTQLSEMIFLSWASLVLGAAASFGDIVARTVLVDVAGLEEVAHYQPVVLLISQMLTVAVSALATSSLVELGSASSAETLGAKVGEICSKVIPIAVGVAITATILAPYLIALFYTSSLSGPATPVLAVAMIGEVPRVYSWVVGSCLLPFGLRNQWLANGLTTVAVQLGVSVSLVQIWGAYGLAWGIVGANCFSAAFTTWLLWRRGIRVHRRHIVTVFAFSAAFGLAQNVNIGEVPIGMLFLGGIVAVVLAYQSRMRRQRVVSE